jgi:parallel beta-helix repeat protein
MQNKRKTLTLLVTVVFIFSLLPLENSIEAIEIRSEEDFNPIEISNRPKLLANLTDPAFAIQGSADLGTYSIGGTGSAGDPYIIAHYRIDARGLPEGIKYLSTWGLHVDFYNNTILGGDNAAISVENVTASTVRMYENHLVNATKGIEFIDTDGHLVNFNNISGCLTGIRFTGDNYEMHNNTLVGCDVGIDAETAFLAFLHNNTMQGCGYGIYSSGCTSSIFNTNVIIDGVDNAIYDRYSDGIQINNNYVYDTAGSIRIYRSTNGYVVGNTVSNCPFDGITLRETEGMEVWSNSLLGCGFNIYDRNITRAATLNFHNDNNYVNGELVKVYQNWDSNYVTGTIGQLFMFNSSSIDLFSLVFSDCFYGITLFDCKDFYIYDNEFYDVFGGIVLFDVDGVEIFNCIIESGLIGIGAYASYSVYIHNCNINENENVGVYLEEVIDAEIYDTNFVNNTNFGVSLELCSDVYIYHNHFEDNGNGTLPQGSDLNGGTNFWYSVTLSDGNWWSNYNGTGAYLIHCQFDDIFDLYPSGPIIIVEYQTVTFIVIMFNIISLVALLEYRRKRSS